MWPYLGPVKTYGPVYLLSILVHVVVALLLARRMGLKLRIPLAISAAYLLGMTVGAKVLFDLQSGHFSFANLVSIEHYMKGGMWGGPLAYLALAVVFALALTGNRLAALDLTALALPIPLAIAKAACLCNGCCYGKPCKLPWAITFPAGDGPAPAGTPLHPTQVYEILMLMLITAVLYRVNTSRWRGTLLLWFLALYGIGRPLTEFFRGDLAHQPHWGLLTRSQWLCGMAGAISIAVLILSRCRSRQEPVVAVNPVGDSLPV
ncbi:MAG: prolipoprotein diacylglyceryl transferase [Phycisphaerae bacterium]